MCPILHPLASTRPSDQRSVSPSGTARPSPSASGSAWPETWTPGQQLGGRHRARDPDDPDGHDHRAALRPGHPAARTDRGRRLERPHHRTGRRYRRGHLRRDGDPRRELPDRRRHRPRPLGRPARAGDPDQVARRDHRQHPPDERPAQPIRHHPRRRRSGQPAWLGLRRGAPRPSLDHRRAGATHRRGLLDPLPPPSPHPHRCGWCARPAPTSSPDTAPLGGSGPADAGRALAEAPVSMQQQLSRPTSPGK